MALWGAEVMPGQEYVHKFSQAHGRLRITRATLGSLLNLGSSTLQGTVGHERRAILCSLNPMRKLTCSLEMELEEEKDVTFSVNGPNSIHLSGFYIIANAPTCTITSPRLLKRTHQEMQDIKKSRREDDTDDDELDEEETDGTQKSNVTPPPPPVCSINKVAKKPNDASTSKKNHKKIDGNIQVISDDEMETTFKGEEEASLKVEKIKEGRSDSKVATDGNKVSINFVGRFKKNGPVFDKGDSFQFELGAGKVVRGLDMGINGMKVGEEREFTIPPSLGYGGIKQENIPANSWLFYKIKLLEVVEETKRTKKGRTDA